MAIKKKTPAKAPAKKKPAAKTKAKAKAPAKKLTHPSKQTPSGPTPEDLAAAKLRFDSLNSQLQHAKRQLEAARSISTLDHRAAVVGPAMAKVGQLRADAEEAGQLVAALKTALSPGNYYRTAALGRISGQKPASAASKRGEPAPRKEKK